MNVSIVPCTRALATFIACDIREHDRRELMANVNCDSITVPAIICNDYSPHDMRWVAKLDGDPVAAFGVSHNAVVQPSVGHIWAFGTDRIKRVIPAISRHMATVMPERAIAHGMRRLEVRALKDHDIAHRWLESLGAERVAELVDFGKNGETFVLYAWTRARWESVKDKIINARQNQAAA